MRELIGRRKKNNAYCCPIDSGSYERCAKINKKRDRREGKKEIIKQLSER